MPGSSARKERRKKAREGILNSIASSASQAAYAESVEDEGEPQGGAVQEAEELKTDRQIDIPSFSSFDPIRELPKESQSSPRRSAHPVLALDGQGALVRGRAYQKQSKSRSKRGTPPRVPRESEPPLGSLYYNYPSVYEEALRTLRTMTPEDSARLKKAVISQMAAEGFSLPMETRLDGAQGVSVPISDITMPSWAPSARNRDFLTKEEAENLRNALIEKLDEGVEREKCAIPSPKALKQSKLSDRLVPRMISGNVDGASQSVETVTLEKETLIGEQATIEQAKGENEQKSTGSKVQAQIKADIAVAPPCQSTQGSLCDESVAINTDLIKDANHTSAREGIDGASTLPANGFLGAGPDDHVDTVSRIDNMTKNLRHSLEQASIGIHQVQESATPYRGITHRSSSSDCASSSGDSGSKLNASRMRRITNDGILELKASPHKINSAKSPGRGHRRKVSLKLPIIASTPQLKYAHPLTQRTHSPSLSTDEDGPSLHEAEERELEYKHRHIFIGTASLDDFLEILEVAPIYTTTKRQVIKAFGLLACAEQVQARQSSISSDGWNFITRTTHDDILTHTDYLTEAHVKLGSITLGKFLARVPFDDKGEVDAIKVVEAFCLVSHLDGEATYGPQSFKAKAFRSWMVRDNAAKHDS